MHIPYSNAYTIAGQVKDLYRDGCPDEEPIVPPSVLLRLMRDIGMPDGTGAGYDEFDGPEPVAGILTRFLPLWWTAGGGPI